ncbi:SRP40, C-terminal domain-containing protein [Cladochytrium replicatum]|nr:SRP40, C-terminal domain-containing protein [Cladochytrium replicatum]
MGTQHAESSVNDVETAPHEQNDNSTKTLKINEEKCGMKEKGSKRVADDDERQANKPPATETKEKKAKKMKKIVIEEELLALKGKKEKKKMKTVVQEDDGDHLDGEKREPEVVSEVEKNKSKKKKRKAADVDEARDQVVSEMIENGTEGKVKKRKKEILAPAEENNEDVAKEPDTPKLKKKKSKSTEPVDVEQSADDQTEVDNESGGVENGKEGTTMDGESTQQSEGKRKKRNSNVPFQRVDASVVSFIDERLKDNSFIAKIGAENSYGLKAHQDLIVTRGKGFRTEKNKKKRGSYRGGKIDMGSHSIKFNYDD